MPAVAPREIETALQFSQLARPQPLGQGTGADAGARVARHVHSWRCFHSSGDARSSRRER